MDILAEAPVDALDGLLPASIPIGVHESAGYHLDHLRCNTKKIAHQLP